MRTQPLRRTSWAARMARGLRPDRNPLRRSADRAEAGLLALLVIVFLAGAPLIALIAWRLTLSATFTTVAARHAGWRQVPAVLLADVPGSSPYDAAVRATWTAPDGAARSGVVYAGQGARAGTMTRILVNASGRQEKWPLTPAQAATQAELIGGFAAMTWALTLLLAGALGHRLIDTRRMAAWDTELRTADLGGPASTSL